MNQDSQPGPITSAERIPYIDILRGMSLFAILAGNMRGFNAPAIIYGNIKVLFHGRADLITQAFVDILLQGKFVTIFSFLFGVGFAVQLTRAEARGARFLSFYPRRLAALALFGLLHGLLIWSGDILQTYAVAGTLLLFFRNRGQKTLLWWAGAIWSIPLLAIVALHFLGPHGTGDFAPDISRVNAIIAIYAHGSIPEILKENLKVWKEGLPTLIFSLYTSFLFLLGMWAWRTGIFNRLDREQPMLRRVCAWCLPIGLALNTFVALVYLRWSPGAPIFFAANLLQLPSAHLLAAGYMAGLAVLVHDKAWLKWLEPFAAVGRMALTNYLMQSTVFTILYYNYTTGLYGRVGPAMDLIPTVIFFAMQVWFSNWWMARFRFGPVEWLWRAITYWKFPPMRRDPERRGLSVSATA
jgi:uncharacterized protein